MLKYLFLGKDHFVQRKSSFFTDMVFVFILNIYMMYIFAEIFVDLPVFSFSSVLENSVSLLKMSVLI